MGWRLAAGLFLLVMVMAGGARAVAGGRLADRSADLLLPRNILVDDRVVVVGYDDREVEPLIAARPFPVPFSARSGVYMTDIATQAAAAGATAVVFVDYDSATLQEGASDRERLQRFTVMSRLAIAPLHNLLLAAPTSGVFPRATRYRVDLLAGSFAGVGVGLGQDQSDGSKVPVVVRTGDLRPELFGTVRPSATLSTNLVPSLALRAVQASGAPVTIDEDGVTVNGAAVPLANGLLRVNWSRRLDSLDDAAVVTHEELSGGKVGADVLAGKIVFVGVTDPAATSLLHTPEGDLPPVLVQANAANTLLTGSFLQAVPGWMPLAALLVVTAVLLALWRWKRPVAVVAALVAITGWPVLAVLLAGQGWLIDLVTVPGGVLVTLGLLVGRAVLRTQRERRRLRRLFREYVPAAVANDLIDSGRAQIAADGERHDVTVLFCDLRGFTPLAATLTPSQVRELLDVYYEDLSPIVLEHGGTLLQYTGDEIYAAFGAPVAQGDHAARALACAVAFLDQQPALARLLDARGLPAVHYGIGLHSGSVVAAHVGSSIRRQYSLLGDVVNVGHRCCSQAGRGTVVYSDATAALLPEPPPGVRDHGLVELKGVSNPTQVWSVDRSGTPIESGGTP